jgi:hypothetical protein
MGVKFPVRDRVMYFDKLSVNTRPRHAALVRGLMGEEDLAVRARKHENSPTPPMQRRKKATAS